jgi:hypothetical protein
MKKRIRLVQVPCFDQIFHLLPLVAIHVFPIQFGQGRCTGSLFFYSLCEKSLRGVQELFDHPFPAQRLPRWIFCSFEHIALIADRYFAVAGQR